MFTEFEFTAKVEVPVSVQALFVREIEDWILLNRRIIIAGGDTITIPYVHRALMDSQEIKDFNKLTYDVSLGTSIEITSSMDQMDLFRAFADARWDRFTWSSEEEQAIEVVVRDQLSKQVDCPPDQEVYFLMGLQWAGAFCQKETILAPTVPPVPEGVRYLLSLASDQIVRKAATPPGPGSPYDIQYYLLNHKGERCGFGLPPEKLIGNLILGE